MTNINETILSAAIEAAIADDAAGAKTKELAAKLAPFRDRVKEDMAMGGDGMDARREAYAFCVAGAFIGYRHAAKDKTFKKGLSAGALAIVNRKAELMAGPVKGEGVLAAKKEANKPFNEAQGVSWDSARQLAKDALDMAAIIPPNARAARTTGTTAKAGEGKAAKVAQPKVAKVQFGKSVVPVKAKKDDPAAGGRALLDVAAFWVATYNANLPALTGDVGAAAREAHELVAKALAVMTAATKAETPKARKPKA